MASRRRRRTAVGPWEAGAAAGKASGPKPDRPAAAETKLRHVNIKRHRTLDIAKADAATALKLRASVRTLHESRPRTRCRRSA